MLVTVLNVYSNGTPAQLWTICDFTTIIPTFVNVITLFMLSGTFVKLLKEDVYKRQARSRPGRRSKNWQMRFFKLVVDKCVKTSYAKEDRVFTG